MLKTDDTKLLFRLVKDYCYIAQKMLTRKVNDLHIAGVGGAAVEDLGGKGGEAHDLADVCILQICQASSIPLYIKDNCS